LVRAFAIAAALAFAAFVTAKGVPTLRHDWAWPVDRVAIPSFLNELIGGWLPSGFGALGAHPTTYMLAVPLALAMWLFGSLPALVLLAIAIGYLCMLGAASLSQRWKYSTPAAVGVGLFTLFNPWVYNEVVAGHLVMVLAYAGLLNLFAEMLRGRDASPVRLALWLALVAVQLQFFIVAMVALAIFAFATRKWLPPIAGVVYALPSIVGLFAERNEFLRIPYNLTWQTNQSVAPAALSALGGYFPGYSDRLGLAAALAVWAMLALALAGAVTAHRSRAAIGATAAAVLLFAIVAGVHGPLAIPYVWIVRHAPESGVFRELYDLAGIFAATIAILACAGAGALHPLRYLALCAGAVLAIAWLLAPPNALWIPGNAYPHPRVVAQAGYRVALLPAFQPLTLRSGGGDGADPDAHGYPGGVTVLNEYLPAYPVDAALARYERSDDAGALRALGVARVVQRPWLRSLSNGRVGLAAASLAPYPTAPIAPPHYGGAATPLVSACDGTRVVALANELGACHIFFGDAGPPYPRVRAFAEQSGSLDPRTQWIDARLGFAAAPALAQGIGGGVLTESALSYPVEPGSALLAYVRGRLIDSQRKTLLRSPGEFRWIEVPLGVGSVGCAGLCELVAQAQRVPLLPLNAPPARAAALPFRQVFPWLLIVGGSADAAHVLRLNERYDAAWTAFNAWRILPHVRVDSYANGWLFSQPSSSAIVLLQVTSLVQMIAEICGIAALACLLKAAAREPTKRAR
jgi:hypothetical protein